MQIVDFGVVQATQLKQWSAFLQMHEKEGMNKTKAILSTEQKDMKAACAPNDQYQMTQSIKGQEIVNERSALIHCSM